MSDTILGADFTIEYRDANRQKRIFWTGGAGKDSVQKMKAVYDATEDLFSVPPQGDDGTIFKAKNKLEYIVGKMDAGDSDPWFIPLGTVEHLIGDNANFSGCALRTSGWARVPGSNTGIVAIAVANATNSVVAGDIGNDISHADGDIGTLLDVVVPGGVTDYLFVRPDTSDAADNFDSAAGTLTCNAHTATQSSASVTGELKWGNVFSGGAIQADTHIYLFQNGVRVTGFDVTDQDYWLDGHIDKPVLLSDYTTDGFPLIDDGYLSAYAAQYTSGRAALEIRMNPDTGGAVSAALASSEDKANTTGYASITPTGGSGNWVVGNEISGDVSGARAILTQVVGSNPTPTLHFFYIGDPLIVFNGSEAISNEDDTGAATGSGAVSSQGPALTTWFEDSTVPVLVVGSVVADVDDDGSDEPYGKTVDLNQCTLAQFHEWQKYVFRRGSSYDVDGEEGQEYKGIDYRVNYTGTVTGSISEGNTVEGVTSGATGYVEAFDGINKVMLLRNTRGEFQDAEQIQVDGSNYIPATGTTVAEIPPQSIGPLGIFTGGIFYGAVGLLLTDYRTTEQNRFSLVDSNGVTRARPIQTYLELTNLDVGDFATAFRLTGAGGDVNKAEYQALGGEAPGDATVTVDSAILVDVPGKSGGGTLVLIDASDDNAEYSIRYASWSGAILTLANLTGVAEAGTDEDTIVDSGVFATAKVGDLVYNVTRDAVQYIEEITDNDTIQLTGPITGQTTGDSFEVNCVPISILSADFVFVPLIHEYIAAGTTISADMTFLADIYALVRVRNHGPAVAQKIETSVSLVTIPNTGFSVSINRQDNEVYG